MSSSGANPADEVQRLFQQALAHQRQGQAAQAEARYAQILELNPRHAPSLHLLGTLALQSGSAQRACEFITRSTEADPTVAVAHLVERSREAEDAEALIAAEVERYHRKLRAVDVAPAIVGLQQRAEELRLAELKRMQVRLGGLTAEQLAAVEALSRGLMNKFLHPPMQALKAAAREGDLARIEAIRETYSLNAGHAYVGRVEAAGDAAPLTAEEAAELLRKEGL